MALRGRWRSIPEIVFNTSRYRPAIVVGVRVGRACAVSVTVYYDFRKSSRPQNARKNQRAFVLFTASLIKKKKKTVRPYVVTVDFSGATL